MDYGKSQGALAKNNRRILDNSWGKLSQGKFRGENVLGVTVARNCRGVNCRVTYNLSILSVRQMENNRKPLQLVSI